MSELAFVDTNVFVYARDGRDAPRQQRAANWIAKLWQERCGRTSTQVLSEYYFTVTHKLTPRVALAEAWDDVRALLAWKPQSIDAAVLGRAREVEARWRLSWWDSMVVAAAQIQGCSLLLTEDLQDGALFGDVTVRSPFTFQAHEPLALYAAVPPAVSRHRARGRPARRALA